MNARPIGRTLARRTLTFRTCNESLFAKGEFVFTSPYPESHGYPANNRIVDTCFVDRRNTALYWNLFPPGRFPTSASVRSGPINVMFEKIADVYGTSVDVAEPSLSDSNPLLSPSGPSNSDPADQSQIAPSRRIRSPCQTRHLSHRTPPGIRVHRPTKPLKPVVVSIAHLHMVDLRSCSHTAMVRPLVSLFSWNRYPANSIRVYRITPLLSFGPCPRMYHR